MENFNYTKKDTYTQEELDTLQAQYKGYLEKTELKPKLQEYEQKIQQYEEQQLFSNIKDTKKVDLIKNLMSTEQYKSLPKQEAFNKISEDYKDFLQLDKQDNNLKPENKQDNNINPTDLILQLHNNSLDHFKIAQELKNKAITTGITDKKELGELIDITRAEALQSMSKK